MSAWWMKAVVVPVRRLSPGIAMCGHRHFVELHHNVAPRHQSKSDPLHTNSNAMAGGVPTTS